MDLRSGESYWVMRTGMGEPSPTLRATIQCDVVVVGAGISGALVGDALARDGHDVVIIDRREPGLGSSAATTALLQYESDAMMSDLVDTLGLARAVRAYQATLDALLRLTELIEGLDEDTHFARRPSLYFASKPDDVAKLQREHDLRKQWDLPIEMLSASDVAARFGFAAPGALWTEVAAEVDPFRLTKALLRRANAHGARIFARTDAVCIDEEPDAIIVRSAEGSVRARHVVFATGFESERFLTKPVSKLVGSFALATEPVDDFPGWPERCLIWETARPYLYARTTHDGRIIVGGEDIPLNAPLARDALLQSRADSLLGRLRDLFPAIPMRQAFLWGGTFGESDDGLPYIGTVPGQDPRRHFALGLGGNGIVSSMLAAEIIRLHVQGRKHPDADLFGFGR